MKRRFKIIEDLLSNIEKLLLGMKHKEVENKLHSVKSLASFSGVSELTIRNWIKQGKIRAERKGRRIFIKEEQFIDGLQEVRSLKYKR
jgi:excisionase family DNA binding protein